MNLIELDRALKQLRLGGMAQVLEARLLQAQTERMAPIDLISTLVADELARRGDRLLARRIKAAEFRDPDRTLDAFDCDFNKKMNREGALAGMIVGIVFTASYIWWFKYGNPAANNPAGWWLGISPEGIGTVGAALNFLTSYVVSKFTKEPPAEIQDLVGSLRYPGKEVPAASSH